MTLEQDLNNLKNYWNWEESGVPIQTVDTALRLKEIQSASDVSNNTSTQDNSVTASYSNTNYSGAITEPDSFQDIASNNPNRDRLTIQNIDEKEILRVSYGDDVTANTENSFVLDPGISILLEEGEADKQVRVASPKSGLKFVAIGRVVSTDG